VLLKLIDEGKLPFDAQGSWAGAMGNTQFMPSNVAAYAIDALPFSKRLALTLEVI
jgi:membrane-bound lytic murein transglycosylase B